MNRKSFKLFFRSLLSKFGSVETDKGILTYDGDNELAVGDQVYVEDTTNPDDIQYVPAPDGEYVAGETTFVVKDSVVDEIRKPEDTADEAPVAEDTSLNVEAEDEIAVETPVVEAPEVVEEPVNYDEAIRMITEKVAELAGRVDALQENVNALLSVPQEDTVFSKYSKIEKKNFKKNLFKCQNY